MFEFANIESLDSYRKLEDKVIFYFETPWDDGCEEFLSKLMEIADTLDGVPVYRVELDLDGGDYIKKKYRINTVPTLVLFESGNEARRIMDPSLLYKLMDSI